MKHILWIMILLSSAVASKSATINWQTDGTFTSGIVDSAGGTNFLSSNWAIVMYHDTDTTLPTVMYLGGGANDASTGMVATTTALDMGQPFGAVYNTAYTDAGLGLGIGSYIYTVIFNNSNVGLATQYAIVDNSVFTIPNYGLNPSFTYDIGATVMGDWQDLAVIPEPTSMALFGVGAMVLLARKKLAKVKK